jgi:glycine cleavage system H protein
MKRYTETHEWIDLQDGKAKVGVSTHAQKELGDIVYVELPKLGKNVQAGEEIAVLESTKAAADVYAPLSGIIVEINESLKENPSLINESPEEKGWLVVLQLDQPSKWHDLMDEASYQNSLN